MKRLLSIVFCIVFVFGLISCDCVVNSEPTASFNTVEELKIAIKHDPTLYVDKQVAVKGYANELTLLNKTVWLYDELHADDELYDGRARIEVVITDSVLLAVVEDGDYIEIYGTVKISDGEIRLCDCTYTMITANEERQ